MILNVMVTLSKAKCRLWKKVLKRKTPVKQGLVMEDTLDAVTTSFTDGYCVSVKLCNGRPPFVDVVLFSPKGNETCAVHCDEFLGEIELDKKHTITIQEGA